MRIALIAKPGHEGSGVGRYARELAGALGALGHDVAVVHPTIPLPGALVQGVRRLPGWDLAAFFANYPVWARYPQADIYHITSQNLATLMLFHRPPGKTVVTVHDIIPHLMAQDAEQNGYRHPLHRLFDRWAMRGVAAADGVITDSDFTAVTLAEALGSGAVSTVTVPLGVS